MKTIEQYNFYYYSILIQPPYTKKNNKQTKSQCVLVIYMYHDFSFY